MVGAPGLAILAKIICMKDAENLLTKIVLKSSSIESGSKLFYNIRDKFSSEKSCIVG
jgi:hypothetical protein